MTEKNEFETIDFEIENKSTVSAPEKWVNIFADFNSDDSLNTELKDFKNKEEKDIFYKLNIISKILWWIFWFLIFIVAWLLVYIYIQKDDTFSDKVYLAPICYIFNWEVEEENPEWCSSISYNNQRIISELNSLYLEQTKQIVLILPFAYEQENFLKTKEISFLLDKSENKLKVLDILAKFDYLKNEFTWYEKKKLQCNALTLNWVEKTLTMKCEAFSNWYTSEIIWFSGNKNLSEENISWTSISIANSFINYLEKNWTKYFLVIDKQKVFESEVVLGNGWYTNKTSFDLTLKINF